MRNLTLLTLLLTVACLFGGASAAAVAQDPVETVPAPTETTGADEELDEEEFGRDFDAEGMPDMPVPREEEMPRLRPIAPPQPTAAPAAGALPMTGADARVLVVAAYWLLLGGVALRRVTRA